MSIKTAAGWWSPHNYKPSFSGRSRCGRRCSIRSTPSACASSPRIGVDKVIEQIRKFGITAQIVRHPSIALGTPEVTLIEHVYGYATFPAVGWK